MGWLPTNNHPADKATYDYHVTIPATHASIANGELAVRWRRRQAAVARRRDRTWNWSLDYPMATYLTTATVGVFDYRKWESAPIGAIGKSGAAAGDLRRASRAR